jgi:hypothetical protein
VSVLAHLAFTVGTRSTTFRLWVPTPDRAMPVSGSAMAQLARSMSKLSYGPHHPARLATNLSRRLVVTQDGQYEQPIRALLGTPPWCGTSAAGEKRNQVSNDSLSVSHVSPQAIPRPAFGDCDARSALSPGHPPGGFTFIPNSPQRAIRPPVTADDRAGLVYTPWSGAVYD